MNDALIFQTDTIALTGDTNLFFGAGAYKTKALIDNVKFWDLERVDIGAQEEAPATESSPVPTVESPAFYEPILTYIDAETPTFEDNFTMSKSKWGLDSTGNSITGMIQNDTLLLVNEDTDINFPVNGLLNATDFVMSFDVFPEEVNAGSFSLIFRSSANLETYYKFKFSFTNNIDNAAPGYIAYDAWFFSQTDGSNIRTTKYGSINLIDDYNNVLIVVRQEYLAIYVNDNLLYEDFNLTFEGDHNLIIKSGGDGSSTNLDNFKFWDLDGVKIGAQEEVSEPVPITTPDPRVLNPANGHLYQLFSPYGFVRNWATARDFCARQGGYIVTIQDASENVFVHELALNNSDRDTTWLGATNNSGSWAWITGEAFAYTNWKSGAPSKDGDYVFLNYDGTWENVMNITSGQGNPYICEWDPEPTTPATDP